MKEASICINPFRKYCVCLFVVLRQDSVLSMLVKLSELIPSLVFKTQAIFKDG